MQRLNDLVYSTSTTSGLHTQTIMKIHQLLALCCHYVVSDQVFKKCCDKTVVYKVECTCLHDMVVFEYLRQT